MFLDELLVQNVSSTRELERKLDDSISKTRSRGVDARGHQIQNQVPSTYLLENKSLTSPGDKKHPPNRARSTYVYPVIFSRNLFEVERERHVTTFWLSSNFFRIQSQVALELIPRSLEPRECSYQVSSCESSRRTPKSSLSQSNVPTPVHIKEGLVKQRSRGAF